MTSNNTVERQENTITFGKLQRFADMGGHMEREVEVFESGEPIGRMFAYMPGREAWEYNGELEERFPALYGSGGMTIHEAKRYILEQASKEVN